MGARIYSLIWKTQLFYQIPCSQTQSAKGWMSNSEGTLPLARAR